MFGTSTARIHLIPDNQVGLDAFSLIRDAMASKKMVGVGRVVLQKRERPILLERFGKGIRGMKLRYSLTRSGARQSVSKT